jgi:mycothiol system anti-sigma-R factor
MNCAEYNEELNALLDGELPAQQAATLAAHLAGCPACAQNLAELAELRAGLAAMLPEEDAPADLQARIEAMLAEGVTNVIPFSPKPRATVARRLSWLAAPALAAALMLALLPRHDAPMKDLLSVHDATMRSASLTTGALAPAPAAAGFQLIGNHTDIVAGHIAQVAEYVRDGKTITLCVWPAGKEPAHEVKQAMFQGMTIKYWNDGDHEYWAASTGPDLEAFVTAVRASS